MVTPNFLLFLALTLGASLSPLLTVSYLWQLKEWRVDRLREHIKHDGGLAQIFGFLRPAAVIVFACLEVFSILPDGTWPLGILSVLTLMSIAQILIRRQPRPVWTMKALVLICLSLILTTIAFFALYAQSMSVIGFLPILQPFFLCLAWLFMKPIDYTLKMRIMKRAREVRAQFPNLKVIGITGSVGKTTTKELLSHLLKDKKMLCTPAHVNTEIGISKWMTRTLPAHPDTEVMIVEMGAYRMGEIALLCSIVKPTHGIITFIGTQHLGLFGSQEKLLQAKSELIRSLPAEGHAFLNADSPFFDELKKAVVSNLTTVGTGGHTDLEAFDIEETSNGIRFRVGDSTIGVPIHGTHNTANVLLALAAAESVEVQRTEAMTKLSHYTQSQTLKTFLVRTERDVTILDDTHNASPASFHAALQWTKSQPFEKKTLVTSGIIELGEAQDRTHTELGTSSAGLFDRVIFLHPRSATPFERGYGKPIEVMNKNTKPVEKNSLLVCIGRMKSSTITALLP